MSLWSDNGAMASILGASVSALAALYARWQATAARESNRLALHPKRLELYESIAQFKAEIAGRGYKVREESVTKLGGDARLSEIFFSQEIHAAAERLFQDALLILAARDQMEPGGADSDDERAELLSAARGMAKALREDTDAVLDQMKASLQVGHI